MTIAFNTRYASMREDTRAAAPARAAQRPAASVPRAAIRQDARPARMDDRMHARMDARVEDDRPARGGGGDADGFWGRDGLTFGDLIDLINPLQHIPVVGAIYRAATGDDLAPGARVLGGALYGGVAGLAGGVVNAIVAEFTGGDVGAHAIALLDGGREATPARVLAANAPAATPPAKTEAAAPPMAAAPTWLSYIPKAKESQAALAARYAAAALDAAPAKDAAAAGADEKAKGQAGAGGHAPAASILDAMARALDKYEAAGGLLPKDGGARKGAVDSLL